MIIYGVAILSLSMLAGLFIGDLLGIAIGVKANVGGVGIAMMVLILLDYNPQKKLAPITTKGITFWSAMYIPIVVAMAAKQNVYAALKGGPLALLAGTLAVAGSFALIPLITKLSEGKRAPKGKEPE